LHNFIHEFERVNTGAVPFVDHGDDGNLAVFTHVEQFHGLGFQTFSGIDKHDGEVDRRQHPVGVFRKVRVTGGVNEVDDGVAVLKLERG